MNYYNDTIFGRNRQHGLFNGFTMLYPLQAYCVSEPACIAVANLCSQSFSAGSDLLQTDAPNCESGGSNASGSSEAIERRQSGINSSMRPRSANTAGAGFGPKIKRDSWRSFGLKPWPPWPPCPPWPPWPILSSKPRMTLNFSMKRQSSAAPKRCCTFPGSRNGHSPTTICPLCPLCPVAFAVARCENFTTPPISVAANTSHICTALCVDASVRTVNHTCKPAQNIQQVYQGFPRVRRCQEMSGQILEM